MSPYQVQTQTELPDLAPQNPERSEGFWGYLGLV